MKRVLLILLVLALCSFSLGQKSKNGGMECDEAAEVDPRDQAIWVTTGSTGTSAHETCGIKNDKWFSVVSPCSNLIQFNLCQSKYDTVLAIYDDSNGDGCQNGEVNIDKFLGCNDDAPSACRTTGGQSYLAVPSKFGQRFLIRVGGFRGSSHAYGEGILYVNCSGEASLETEELQIPSVGAAGATTKLVVKPAGYKDSVNTFDFYSYDGSNFSKLVATEAPYTLDTGEVRSRGSFVVDGETLNWESTSFLDESHTYRTSFQVSSDTRIPATSKIFGVLDLNVDDNPKELLILDQNPLESGKGALVWEKRGLFFGYQINGYSGVAFDGWRLQKASQPFTPTFSPNGSTTISTYNSSKSYFPSDYSIWGQSDSLLGLSIQLNPTDDDGITNVNFGFFLSPTIYADDRSFTVFQGDNVTGNVFEKSVTFGHPATVQIHQHTGNSSGNRFTVDTATGEFTYVANSFYDGTDTVTYLLINNDAPLDRSVGVLTFVVKIDDRPRPFPDFYNTSEQTELYVNASLGVLANDLPVKNPNKPALVHIKGHTNTTNGTLLFNEKDGSFTYRPYRHFNGVDTFTYTLKNNAGDSTTTNVTITVASVDFPPVAGNDTFTVNEDSVLNATIWDNDVEQEGSGYVIAVLVSYPAGGNGSFTWDNGTFVYTPPADFNGNTSFVYYLDNGVALSENATVNITVLAVNDPPIANPSTFTLLEDIPFVGDASRNDQDKDGDPLTYSVLVPPAQSQEFTLYENGTFAYTPVPNFQGNDSFVYAVQDPSGEVANATVVLVVVNENDAPVAVDDYYHVMEGGSKIVADLQGVLANDTDVDYNTTLVAALDTTVLHGVLNLNPNGSFEYIPNEYYFGVDKFTYRATDGNRTSDIAVVTFNVTSVPNPPIANPDNYTIYEDSPLVISDYDHGVLANDFDPDGDFLTARLLNKTSNALVTVYSNGTFVYRPRKNFNGQDTFFYNVSDGYSWTPGRVTVRILSVNDLPVPNPDYYTTNMDTRLVVDAANGVLKNDTDPIEREPLQIKGYTQPGNGSVTLYNNGSFVYTPKTGFVGADKFNYTIADASGGRANTTVTIDVVKTKSVALIVIIIIVVIAGILVAIYFVRRRRTHEDLPDGQTPQRLFS